MTMVGIRELKAHLSRYLRKVKNGEAVGISEHGKQIALLTPTQGAPQRSGLWELVRQGKVDWNGKHADFKSKPLIQIKGKPMSETIIEGREDRV